MKIYADAGGTIIEGEPEELAEYTLANPELYSAVVAMLDTDACDCGGCRTATFEEYPEAEEGDEPITAAEAADLLFSSARLAEALGRRLLDPKRTAANPEYTRKLLNRRWLCAVADVMRLPRFPE